MFDLACADGEVWCPVCRSEGVAHRGSGRLSHCSYLNASVCHPTVEMSRLGHDILVAIYNPLAWPRSEGVRVPINTSRSANWTVAGMLDWFDMT